MSHINNPTLGSYSVPPLSVNGINIAPLSTDSIQSLSSNSIASYTISGAGGGGTGAYGMGSANVTWATPTSYTGPNISINPLQTITLNPNVYSNTYTNGTTQPGTIQIKGDAEFEGKIKVGGKDLVELLTKIEDRLAIYKCNPELEEKWEELRELSKRYKELEAEIKEKEQVWDILKK